MTIKKLASRAGFLLATLLGSGLVTAQDSEETLVALTNAQLLPDSSPSLEATQLYIELSSETNLTDKDQFLCEDVLQVFELGESGDRINLLPRANCRFCPSEGLTPSQGILILPQIKGLADVVENSPFFLELNADEEAVEIEVLPEAPKLNGSFILTKKSFALTFTDDVVVIRGQRLASKFDTFCSNLAQFDFSEATSDAICGFDFDLLENAVVVSVENNARESLENGFFSFDNDSFFGAEEKFGLKPVEFESVSLGFLPKLEKAEFLDDFSFVLTFDSEMNQKNQDRFLCSDLFTYEVQEGKIPVEVWNERDDLFCALRWRNSTAVSVQFTDFVPFLLDGQISVKDLSVEAIFAGAPSITAADGFAHAIGTAFVSIDSTIYDAIKFSIQSPTDLTRCDKTFIVQVDQIAGPPLLVDFEFSIQLIGEADVDLIFSVEDDCVTEGNILSCDTLNTTGITFAADDIFYAPTIIGSPFIGEKTTTKSQILDVRGKDITQNVVAFKIPIAVSGVNSQTPSVQIQRGTSAQLRGELGDVFGCVGNVATEQLVFNWTITDENQKVVINQLNRKTLIIGGSALPPGTFTASFSASLPQGSVLPLQSNTISFDLIVEAAPVVALSAVGDSLLVSSAEGIIILDASISCNPNIITDCTQDLGIGDPSTLGDTNDDTELRLATGFADPSFSLGWSCDDCGDFDDSQIFAGVDPNRMVVKLDVSGLGSLPDVLKFKFTITDSANEEAVSFNVAANIFQDAPNCLVPKISIAPVGKKVNIGASLTIFGSVAGFDTNFDLSEIEILTWSLETTAASISPLLQDFSTLQREKLFIPPDTLVEGETYTFRLSAVPKCASGIQGFSVPFAELSFATNRRPTGGKLAVAPLSGVAVTDLFTLTAVNWRDPDGDSPLQYAFEIAFISSDELASISEIGPQDATQLRAFTPSNIFQTTLPLPPVGSTLVLISLARDATGSVSRRLISATKSDVDVQNPFVSAGKVDVNVTVLVGLIDDLSNTGDKSEIPSLCSAISSALNDLDLSEEQTEELGGSLLEARQLCLGAVGDTLQDLDAEEVDVDLINLVANSVKQISGGIDDADEGLLADIDAQTGNLIDLANSKVQEAQRGGQDPTAGSLLPDNFRDNIINSIGNSLSITDSLLGDNETIVIPEQSAGRRLKGVRRRLQGEVSKCDVVGSARSNVENLANLQNSFVVAGAPPVDAKSSQVRFAAVRESFNEIGEKTKAINVPGGQNDVSLPNGFAGDVLNQNQGLNANADVNVLATKWDFPVRCEDRTPDPLVCTDTYGYDAPLQGKEGPILAVDFFPFEGETQKSLKVNKLSAPIVIILDAPEGISDEKAVTDLGGNCTEQLEKKSEGDKFRETKATISFPAVCGFFDEELGDFSTEDCETELLPDGRVKCSCTHATDYAAWSAFKYDVAHTFKDQIVLTPLAKRFIFTFFPVVFGLGTIMFIWAVRQDKKDSKNILKAALARLKLFRVLNRRKKMRFFENYEIAKLQMVMGEAEKKYKISDESEAERQIAKPKRATYWMQFYLAIKYEHSVIGIIRYDPNFSRVQRVAVFFAVVVANFGAAALVYELNSDQYQVSILVTVGVSFASAFLVSIPVKMMVRLLFKATANFIGSSHDMVNNMYRVLTRVEKADGVESEQDRNLVDAVHGYMDVERKMELVTKKKDKLKRLGTKAPSQRGSSEEGGDSVIENAKVLDEENYDEDEVLAAKQMFSQAKAQLQAATESARIYWGQATPSDEAEKDLVTKPVVRKFYTSWDKIKSSRRQPNAFLKFASVVGEEPSPVAKQRSPWFPSQMVFMNWVALFIVVGFYSFYIVKFIGTRSERAKNPPEDLLDADFDPITESEYLSQWVIGGLGGIIVSYVIAEPLIALIRCVLLPMVVTKFGKNENELDEHDVKNAKLDPEKKGTNIREGYGNSAIELMAELAQSVF